MIDAVTEREPPISASADLRQIGEMPVDVEAIRALAQNVSAEAFRAAVLLHCHAWHQVPAGSILDDDHHLAAAAGLALDDAWTLTKVQALTGFTLHSDGRLYHPGIVEKALAVLADVERKEKRKADDRRRAKLCYDRKTGKVPTKAGTETSQGAGDRHDDATSTAPSPTSTAPSPSPPPNGTAPSQSNEPATSCGDPIRDAKPHASSGQAAPTAIAGPPHEIISITQVEPKLTTQQWDEIMLKYRVHGTWSWREFGPSPRFPTCRAPSFILAKHGYPPQAT